MERWKREREKERGKDYRKENCVTSSCPPWLCICVFTFQLWFYPRQPQDVTDLKEEVKLKCLQHSRLDSRLIETKSMKVCIHMIHVRFISVSNNVCKLFSRTSGIGYNYIRISRIIMFPFCKCQPKYTSCLSFIGSACSFCSHVSWCCHVLTLSSLYNMTDCFAFTIKSQPTSSIFILFHPSFFSPPIKVILLWADMRSNRGPLLLHSSFAFSLGFLRVCFANSFASLTHTEPIHRERTVRGQTERRGIPDKPVAWRRA